MAAKKDEHGKIIEKGVEDYLPARQYNNDDHRGKVVEDILKNWDILSKGEKGTQFHAILSTTSIAEACIYYEIFNSTTNLNVSGIVIVINLVQDQNTPSPILATLFGIIVLLQPFINVLVLVSIIVLQSFLLS